MVIHEVLVRFCAWRCKRSLKGVTLLGKGNVKPAGVYSPEVLEAFSNKHRENDYMVTFTCPEFTCICPMTGQPGFMAIYVNCGLCVKLVESKSLKFYLFSFRSHSDFHEDAVNVIVKDWIRLVAPKHIEIKGDFFPRGGISISPFADYESKGARFESIAEKRMLKVHSVL